MRPRDRIVVSHASRPCSIPDPYKCFFFPCKLQNSLFPTKSATNPGLTHNKCLPSMRDFTISQVARRSWQSSCHKNKGSNLKIEKRRGRKTLLCNTKCVAVTVVAYSVNVGGINQADGQHDAREDEGQHDAREANGQQDAREAEGQHDAREANRQHDPREADGQHDAREAA